MSDGLRVRAKTLRGPHFLPHLLRAFRLTTGISPARILRTRGAADD